MASFAAILAIGKPVAFDASALERETRGFISMTTRRPVSGGTANWMLQPPGSTPTARSPAMPTAGAPRVHLDAARAPGVGVDGELDVAAAGVHADRPQHGDADVAHLLVLAVGEGHRGGDGHRVAGVHAHRVDVLDRADDDHVVAA